MSGLAKALIAVAIAANVLAIALSGYVIAATDDAVRDAVENNETLEGPRGRRGAAGAEGPAGAAGAAGAPGPEGAAGATTSSTFESTPSGGGNALTAEELAEQQANLDRVFQTVPQPPTCFGQVPPPPDCQ